MGLWSNSLLVQHGLPSPEVQGSATPREELDAKIEIMAEQFFGYGRWDAPFWFIGPEPAGGNHSLRAHVWFNKFANAQLCDCEEFHKELQVDWSSGLNKTWKRLMLLLRAFLGKQWGEMTLLDYQRSYLGAATGDTCVIELRGLNTKDNPTYKNSCSRHLESRVKLIRQRLSSLEKKPELIVFYGKSERPHWERIAGMQLEIDSCKRENSTAFAFAHHPNARGKKGDLWLTDSYWEELGKDARRSLL